MDTTGRIIFLNGASSSGKTTIGRALQEALDELYLLVSADGFLSQLPESFLAGERRFSVKLPVLVHAFHATAAAQALAGMNIILDHVLQDPAWLDDCLGQFCDIEVLFVAIKCPLPELKKREADRGNRSIGSAKSQYNRVHAHNIYDLELDTAILSPEQCVATIAEHVRSGTSATAFDTLRRQRKGTCEQNKGEVLFENQI